MGSGYPLQFEFMKYCALILFVILISSGIYNLATNYWYGIDCQASADGSDESSESSQNV